MRTKDLVSSLLLLWLLVTGAETHAQVINGETTYDDTMLRPQAPARDDGTAAPDTARRDLDHPPPPSQNRERHD